MNSRDVMMNDHDIDDLLLSPRERARDRKRDRRATAKGRVLMDNGGNKFFKQVLDKQVSRGLAAQRRLKKEPIDD